MAAVPGGKASLKPKKDSMVKAVLSVNKLVASTKAMTSSVARLTGQASAMEDYADANQTVQKPDDQLELTDKELNEEITRVLKATNPHAPDNLKRFSFKEGTYKQTGHVDQLAVHYELQSTIIHQESDEAIRQLEREKKQKSLATKSQLTTSTKDAATSTSNLGGQGTDSSNKMTASTSSAVGPDGDDAAQQEGGDDGEGGPPRKLHNQFNFSDRATLTYNNPPRDRSTMTIPPPRSNYSGSVTQWEIYDAYTEEIERQQREKEAKERKKGGRDEQPVKGKSDDDLIIQPSAGDCAPVAKAAKILERMINQNMYDGIAQDFKYYEDPLDDGRKPTGTLMPLWRFSYDGAKRMTVTSIALNPLYSDLFAVGYGSYSFEKPAAFGVICFHSLKNPSFPEFIFHLPSGIMCLDIHPTVCYYVAVGLYDGSVAILDMRQAAEMQPCFQSAVGDKHSDPVWQVRWQKEDMEQRMNFCSVSSDGHVACWTINKIQLERTEVVTLPVLQRDGKMSAPDGAAPVELACGTCFDFSPVVENVYLVGTEEGVVHKCSKTYSTKVLSSFRAHDHAIYSVRWNHFEPRVFATCSADWTVKLWDDQMPGTPLFKFDFNDGVSDFDWSPFSATVFAVGTEDGTVRVFDLSVDKYEPLCQQLITQKKNMRLTRLVFNKQFPMLLAGDDRGYLTSLKLSPNLRSALAAKTYSRENEVTKMNRLIAWVQQPAEHK